MKPTTWYLRAGGHLDRTAPAKSDHGSDQYRYDPSSVSATDSSPESSDLFAPTPPYNWKRAAAGAALTYTTDPLTSNVVLTGPASANLWLRTTAPDTDLEAAITEVRPDGQETYVQSGWLRASHRTTLNAATSTALAPQYTDEAGKRLFPLLGVGSSLGAVGGSRLAKSLVPFGPHVLAS